MPMTSLQFQPLPNAAAPRSAKIPAGNPARSRLSTSLTLAAMSLGYGVVQFDVTIVNTALNSIGTSLGGGLAELQWVVSSYTIAFAAFILTAGAAGRPNRRAASRSHAPALPPVSLTRPG